MSASTNSLPHVRSGRSWIVIFGLLIFLDFLLLVVMLVTDKNLQTDFGNSKYMAPSYFLHWYGLLAEAILTLLVAFSVIGNALAPSMWAQRPRRVKAIVLGGLVWVILALLADLAIVFTWSQVGFQNMSQFAMYLYDTASPPASGYIPWLYDALIAMLVLTALVGVVAWARVRTWGTTPIAA
jgi:hypothetical protein